MIAIPELLIVLGVFALIGGYIAFVHYLLSHSEGEKKTDSSNVRLPEA